LILASASNIRRSSVRPSRRRGGGELAEGQNRVSAGAEHDLNQHWRIGINYTYLWLGNNAVDAQASPLTVRE